MNAIELNVFSSRMAAVCEEMGAVLRRTAFSPNIKDRLDFSCAVFDVQGELCAQAAHIPVHLGSMAYAMKGIVSVQDWTEGDMLIVNDPFLGGTHLPDITLIAPVFVDQQLLGFVANRAHHADIGASTPGSMPISKSLHEEGMLIPPSLLIRRGQLDDDFLASLLSHVGDQRQGRGDFSAQISANQTGVRRLQALIESRGVDDFHKALYALNDYAERLARNALADIPDGDYVFEDFPWVMRIFAFRPRCQCVAMISMLISRAQPNKCAAISIVHYRWQRQGSIMCFVA
jgi:N-methylhydantoinase B